ncbi:MAG: hypothetical protein JWQ89_855 [Devosia sp.]|uniref:hypothetical protein n=1 Tax=Devosia sp. TaxID=1871048 RepID=UPI0026394BDC|nr:hypothetical protein [Devosia sp.]MDB5539128.1 hypothetical protein [Devosia sp.]
MKRKFEALLLGVLLALGLAACSSMGGGNWSSSNGGRESLHENTESGNWPTTENITSAGGSLDSTGHSGSGGSDAGGGTAPPEGQ